MDEDKKPDDKQTLESLLQEAKQLQKRARQLLKIRAEPEQNDEPSSELQTCDGPATIEEIDDSEEKESETRES